MIEIKVLNQNNWNEFSSQLQGLEGCAEYPLGDDFFKINHGESYFEFFQRLGEPTFHVALHEGKVVACGAGILRSIATSKSVIQSWYLCDLKVHPDFRNQGLPARMFRKNVFRNFLKCPRGYGISMNPHREFNRVVSLVKKFPFFSLSLTENLHFFSLDAEQMQFVLPQLKTLWGPISFLSLKGKKDLIMKSSQSPMPLLHLQHGTKLSGSVREPQRGFVHMMCAPVNSKIENYLAKNFSPSATASILSYNMKKISWDFVLTSDI